ncbi:MAG TPA: hypothetical protein VFG79_22145 [Solirubrobacter sp.]|nr:hypothetical protein [Solirubrobacter sp.]
MGLLDDAIREHLELKRKHGANPDDVARQEQEALGPSPRNEFAQPEAGDEPAPPAEPEAAETAETTAATEIVEPEPEPELAEPAPEREGEPEPPLNEPPQDASAVAAGYEEDPWLEEERDEVPAEEALQPPRTGDEDVLEETPDFLQETPEHDRLWFEQKPPRDFDWDK